MDEFNVTSLRLVAGFKKLEHLTLEHLYFNRDESIEQQLLAFTDFFEQSGGQLVELVIKNLYLVGVKPWEAIEPIVENCYLLQKLTLSVRGSESYNLHHEWAEYLEVNRSFTSALTNISYLDLYLPWM